VIVATKADELRTEEARITQLEIDCGTKANDISAKIEEHIIEIGAGIQAKANAISDKIKEMLKVAEQNKKLEDEAAAAAAAADGAAAAAGAAAGAAGDDDDGSAGAGGAGNEGGEREKKRKADREINDEDRKKKRKTKQEYIGTVISQVIAEQSKGFKDIVGEILTANNTDKEWFKTQLESAWHRNA
jgi:hypothetical protein